MVEHLTFRTRLLDSPPPRLVDLFPEQDGLAWVREGQGLVGFGQAAAIEVAGTDPFGSARAWWRELLSRASIQDDVRLPGTGAVAFGSFGFDSSSTSSVMIVPRVLVGHRKGTWWVTAVDDAPADPRPTGSARAPSSVAYGRGSSLDDDWQAIVREAVGRIQTGELDKVVLARDVRAQLEEPLDVRWPVRVLSEDYASCWTFSIDGLIGSSPEPLLQLRDGLVVSRVLAGTRPRATHEGVGESARSVADSVKDREEHQYSVTSVASALQRHCSSVEVPPPFVLELPNLTHLATDVTGVVRDGSDALQLLGSLHPTAAVCGTPTATALEMIREIEGLDRWRYAGPVGWTDSSGDGDWCIALRCARIEPGAGDRLRLFGGGGIVRGSVPAEEFAESEAKLLPMKQALRGRLPGDAAADVRNPGGHRVGNTGSGSQT